MGKHLKLFETHADYESAESSLILPNVSVCLDQPTVVHYNPYVEPPTPIETRLVAKFNITDTSSPTDIGYEEYTSGFSAIEIDGVVQPSVVSAYTFSTTGEHTVKYTLADPTSIGANAFIDCYGLTSIDIPDSVTSIGNYAFSSCNRLTSVNIPDGVTSIGDGTFRYCHALASVTIGSGVTSIGWNAFSGCTSLTSVNIPDSVTSIGQSAFQNCSGLTSVTIGSGVTSISYYAFYQCLGLTSITSNAITAPTIQSTTFNAVKANGTLYVPIGSTGYDVWMGTGDYYLGMYNWTKVEQ